MSESEDEVEKGYGRSRRVASRSTVSTLLAGNFGKLPPQAVDLEEALLGALMLERNVVDDAMKLLHEDFFYKDTHSIIFKAARLLYTKREPIDILTITNQLKTTGELDIVGGPFFITQLTNRMASSANFEFHSMIVKEKWAQREIIRISSEAIKECYEDTADVFNAKNRLDTEIQKVSERLIGNSKALSWPEQLNESVVQLENMHFAPTTVTGITTGSIKLNRVTSGWQPTDLIIVGARPGMGKTARVGNWAKAACLEKHSVLFFSMEMGYGQITKRFLSEDTEIFNDRMKNGSLLSNVDITKFKESAQRMSQFRFELIDKPALTPNDIRAYARARKKKEGLDLIVIDYLQLMRPNEYEKGKTRDRELGEITGALKALAKELEIPIIALSQLSRTLESRNNKRPQLSDLRESGSIEQDADMVLALYRPSEYHDWCDRQKYETDYKDHSEDDYNRASELLILKFRNGAHADCVQEYFVGPISRFTTIEEEARQADVPPAAKSFYVQRSFLEPDKDEQTDDLPF